MLIRGDEIFDLIPVRFNCPPRRRAAGARCGAHGLDSLITSQRRRSVRTLASKSLSWPRPSARSATHRRSTLCLRARATGRSTVGGRRVLLCFVNRRVATRLGSPASSCFVSQRAATRSGSPSSSRFASQRAATRSGSPSSSCFVGRRAETRSGSPSSSGFARVSWQPPRGRAHRNRFGAGRSGPLSMLLPAALALSLPCLPCHPP